MGPSKSPTKAEKAWMDHWILGKGKFQWQDVLKTLEEPAAAPKAATTSNPE